MAVTKAEKKAASNQVAINKFNADSSRRQFTQADLNYDLSDTQNRALAGAQMDQNTAKSADDRFAQQKKVQSSTRGLLAAAGNALQGSGAGNLVGMLRTRQDLDTGEALSVLRQNQEAVRNALTESTNANVLARNDAANATENELRRLEADTAAQLNNIDPNLFVKPGTGRANFKGTGFGKANRMAANKPPSSGYITTAPTAQPTGSSYYDKYLSSYR